LDRVCAGAACLVEDFRLGKSISKEAPNFPEMEFLNDIFSRGFRAKLEFFSDSSFCLVFYLHFSILLNAFHEKTQVVLFCGFFACIFKTRVEYGFL
jgi:hypothetical protein